jgi:hypothetical protein
MLRWPGRDSHCESDRKEEQLDALKKRIMEEVQTVGKAYVNEMVLHMAASSCALPSSLAEDDVAGIIEEVRQVG